MSTLVPCSPHRPVQLRPAPLCRGRLFLLFPLVAGLIAAGPLARAQGVDALSPNVTRGEVPGQPWVGERGVTETVAHLMARRGSDDMGGIGGQRYRFYGRPFQRARRAEHERAHKGSATPDMDGEYEEGRRTLGALSPTSADPAASAPQRVSMDFLGATYSDTPGFTPPDAMGAAGLSQFLVCINGRIRTFNKTTGLPDGALNLNTDTFFQSVDNGTGVSDPRVRYDRLSGRWFIVVINVPSGVNNYILIAVSSGADITSASSFTFYRFRQDQVAPTGNLNQFADYPTLGVDKNALYIGCNMFDSAGSFTGTTGWVVRKSSVLGTGPIVATAFRNLATATYSGGTPTYGPGPYTPQGVDNDDPNATVGYFIGVDNSEFGKLTLRRVSNPGTTPTISANIFVTVPDTTYPAPVTPLGSTCPLDTLDDRLLTAQIHLNVLTGERTLWTVHAIEVDASGFAADDGGRAGSRWYEVANLPTTPTLKQSGTVFDPVATGARSYFNPSLAMSGQGHMALGCTYASPTEYAGVAVTGRLSSDPPGEVRPPTLAVTSLYPYNSEACTAAVPVQRWGDYSYTCVDPEDAMTMWTVQEYTHAPNTWGIRVLRLQAPPPAAPTAVSLATLTPGTSNVTITVTGTSTDGSGFFDPGSTYPKHITASLGGNGVTVNSLTFISPTQVTLNVSVAATATPGLRPLTITNPDGQAVTTSSLVRVSGPAYTRAELTTALRIAGGLLAPTATQVSRLNSELAGSPTPLINIADAVRLARKLAGLEPNP